MVMSWQANEPLTHDNAHGRPEKLDPRVNGPFLDDIRREQERAYREQRMRAEESKNEDTAEIEPVEEEEEEEDE
jgi:hypothetical protein